MTEQDIRSLFASYRNHEIELNMMENCVAALGERYDVISKKLALADDLLRVVSVKERRVLSCHLIDGMSWAQLSNESNALDLPGDDRALQRIQKRALQRLYLFTSKRFGNTLDYLLEKTPTV